MSARTELLAQHGSAKRYHHGPDENGVEGRGCRCSDCTEAQRHSIARYKAMRRQGVRGTVPSGPARKALGQLRRYGWTATAVGHHLGLGDPANILRSPRCTVAVHRGVLDLLASERAARDRRFDFAPVASILVARGYESRKAHARFLEVDLRQVYRWVDNGLTVDAADLLACQLNYHPTELWPDYHEDQAA